MTRAAARSFETRLCLKNLILLGVLNHFYYYYLSADREDNIIRGFAVSSGERGG